MLSRLVVFPRRVLRALSLDGCYPTLQSTVHFYSYECHISLPRRDTRLNCHLSEVKGEAQVQYQMLGIDRTTRLPFIVYSFTSRQLHSLSSHNINITNCARQFFYLVFGTPGAFKLVLALCRALREDTQWDP